MASIEVNVHVQTICHSRRRANAYWCSFFIECRWQRCLGRVKGASWGSSKNGMIETWDITYEVYLSGNYMKDFEFDSIHSSETTKINSVGKRASFVSIWYRPLECSEQLSYAGYILSTRKDSSSSLTLFPSTSSCACSPTLLAFLLTLLRVI